MYSESECSPSFGLPGSLLHQPRSYVISETPSIPLGPANTVFGIITLGATVA
ncbi:MAG: hypothetical protein AAFV43_01750 [Planctomycetota bacterium]